MEWEKGGEGKEKEKEKEQGQIERRLGREEKGRREREKNEMKKEEGRSRSARKVGGIAGTGGEEWREKNREERRR